MTHTHSHHPEHSEHSELGHTIPYRTYVTVLVILLILTVITVAASRVDFGNLNLVVAMLIASVKAGIVGMFFMHLKYEKPLIWIYVAFPILLLFVLLGGLFIDNPTRWDPKIYKETGLAGPDHQRQEEASKEIHGGGEKASAPEGH